MINNEALFDGVVTDSRHAYIDVAFAEMVANFGEAPQTIVNIPRNRAVIIRQAVWVQLETIKNVIDIGFSLHSKNILFLGQNNILLGLIGLIPHFADEFFKDILKSDDAFRSAILISDYRDVVMGLLHQTHGRGNHHGPRHGNDREDERGKIGFLPQGQNPEQRLDADVAQNVVQISPI